MSVIWSLSPFLCLLLPLSFSIFSNDVCNIFPEDGELLFALVLIERWERYPKCPWKFFWFIKTIYNFYLSHQIYFNMRLSSELSRYLFLCFLLLFFDFFQIWCSSTLVCIILFVQSNNTSTTKTNIVLKSILQVWNLNIKINTCLFSAIPFSCQHN